MKVQDLTQQVKDKDNKLDVELMKAKLEKDGLRNDVDR